MVNYIRTAGGIHLVIQGKPVAVSSTDPHFEAVVNALREGESEDAITEILEGERRKLEAAARITDDIQIVGGQVLFQGDPVSRVLSDRMIQMVDEGFDLKPMVAFIENLMQNPSKRVVDHLYEFLEYGKNPLTEDGCFLAYKAVRDDFKDIHSGTMDNSIGAKVSMPRNRVDENPDNTCSAGLHVCSFEYLPHFAHANGHVVVCKVNPKDVVAIPRDYHNTKMRVAAYEVIREHEGYYEQQGDVLAKTSVDVDAAGGAFRILVDRDGDGTFEPHGSYQTLLDAAQAADDVLDDVAALRIQNVATGAILDEQENPSFVPESDAYDDPDALDDTDVEDSPFRVEVLTQDGRKQVRVGFETLADAMAEMASAVEDDGAREAFVYRTSDGAVMGQAFNR